MWGKSKPAQTFGQTFEEIRRKNEAARAAAMKPIVQHFVEDVKRIVQHDSEKDPSQKVFIYHTADILTGDVPAVVNITTLVMRHYFKAACGKSTPTPTADELTLFSDAVLVAAINQDYEVMVQHNGGLITIDFTNTEKLAAERIAAESVAAAEKARIASALDKITGN